MNLDNAINQLLNKVKVEDNNSDELQEGKNETLHVTENPILFLLYLPIFQLTLVSVCKMGRTHYRLPCLLPIK